MVLLLVLRYWTEHLIDHLVCVCTDWSEFSGYCAHYTRQPWIAFYYYCSFRFHFARFIESEPHITNAGLHTFHSIDGEDSKSQEEWDNGQRREKKKLDQWCDISDINTIHSRDDRIRRANTHLIMRYNSIEISYLWCAHDSIWSDKYSSGFDFCCSPRRRFYATVASIVEKVRIFSHLRWRTQWAGVIPQHTPTRTHTPHAANKGQFVKLCDSHLY